MIKAAGVAGAAAWTAPMIIDSLSSPAAAGSVCNIYWVKLDASTGDTLTPCCYSAPPLNNSPVAFVVSDAKWAGKSTCGCGNPSGTPSGTLSGGVPHMPTQIATSSSSYVVTLATGCTFNATKTTWKIGGRYNNTTQYGTATDGANTGSIPKTLSSTAINWIYLKFCCDTA